MAKNRVNWNRPNQIGYFVYQYAKLKMLDFFYNCVQKYVSKEDYSLVQCDTDSMYFSISGNSLDMVIKPESREAFYKNFHLWFPSPSCDRHRDLFVRTKTSGNDWDSDCEDCKKRQAFDKRTPGLFKLEWSGDGCIALTSKTYVCFGGDSKFKDTKVASKGLSTSLNTLTRDIYFSVLESKKPRGGLNRGFRTMDHKVITYEQSRDALPYLYIKRKVGDDGVSTTPLDI